MSRRALLTCLLIGTLLGASAAFAQSHDWWWALGCAWSAWGSSWALFLLITDDILRARSKR